MPASISAANQYTTIIPMSESPDEPFKSYEQRKIDEEVEKMKTTRFAGGQNGRKRRFL